MWLFGKGFKIIIFLLEEAFLHQKGKFHLVLCLTKWNWHKMRWTLILKQSPMPLNMSEHSSLDMVLNLTPFSQKHYLFCEGQVTLSKVSRDVHQALGYLTYTWRLCFSSHFKHNLLLEFAFHDWRILPQQLSVISFSALFCNLSLDMFFYFNFSYLTLWQLKLQIFFFQMAKNQNSFKVWDNIFYVLLNMAHANTYIYLNCILDWVKF
jgi:hypothetical protein